MRLQRIGMCTAILFLVAAAGTRTAFSRPLAGGPAVGGFLLVSRKPGEDPAAAESAPEPGTVDAMSPDSAQAAPYRMTPDSAASRPIKTKNPTGALLRSLALPGWGQLYNEQYLKSALALAAEGLLVAGAVVEHQRAEDDHALYQDPSLSDAVRESAWNRYSRRIDKRNAYLWYYAGFKFLSIIDAYVDAHLYHFDEGPFGVEVRPQSEGAMGLTVMVRCDL